MAANRNAARLLRELRETQGLSLRAVADDIGIAASQLSRFERGERNYSSETSRLLARYYGVPAETLELHEGRVPEDILTILQAHPEVIDDLRARYGVVPLGETS